VIHDSNGPISGLHLKDFRLCNDLNDGGTAHKPSAPLFHPSVCSFSGMMAMQESFALIIGLPYISRSLLENQAH
jgi:hypothetical protein